MKTKLLILIMLLAPGAHGVMAFCGFYVAKADATLFNQKSQVIIVRDQNRTVITMSSDFKGDVKDFAMVVPVPEVLSRDNIRIAKSEIFDKLDAYSAPRLVEYYDANPCMQYLKDKYEMRSAANAPMAVMEAEEANGYGAYKVTVEASYTVGEYDILILSAQESGGLKAWLTDNGYKIPENAGEMLDPYIKDGLKFFVVKVNLEAHKKQGYAELRPIQIAFSSNRFGLPIRLGMANASGDQDLIVYAFTRKGRVEVANYRTVELPTDRNVPEFVQQKFGNFFKDLFKRSYEKEGGKAAFLEYAWDLSSKNFVKCDPCSTTPPEYTDLREAGVFWVQKNANNGWNGSDYQGDVFITRLHVRYNRKNFPQDLAFQTTPDMEHFQGRYIIQHAVKEDLSCDDAQKYYQDVAQRRERELRELASLTGWKPSSYASYVDEYSRRIGDDNRWIGGDNFIDKNSLNVSAQNESGWMGWFAKAMMAVLAFVLLTTIIAGRRKEERARR
ncbi:MAG: DUF2330 domain-containing protein [Flavobacteriales bacterium]|nr:DUF2330 domain-containing protein [Flavobacteriales bacterium]MCB9449589.1 DUF2330 domain-containing protein [Flavobacteriales bacterium]